MELITVVLAVWVLALSIKVGNHTKSLEQVHRTLSRFKPVGKKKATEEVARIPPVPETAQPVHASGVVQDKSPQLEGSIQETAGREVSVNEPKESFENLLIKKILPTIGVLSVLLAVIFVVTWSYTNNYIGPGILIILAFVASAVTVLLGEFFRIGYPKYYGYVTSAGLLGLFATLYTSHGVYEFITRETAFILYSALIILSYGIALRYNNRIISFLVSAGSFVIPQLVAGKDPQPYVLVTYSSLIFIAGSIIMYKKDWRETIVAVFISLLLYAGMLVDAVTGLILHPGIFLVWVYGALAVFAWVIIARVSQANEDETTGASSVMTGSTVGLLLSFVTVNIFANIIFSHFNWPYFGFFVLIQGLILYGLSLLIPEDKPRAYKELFIIGACGAVLFAIFYELGFEEHIFFTALSLFAYGALALFVSKQVTPGRSVYMVFGYLAQVAGVITLFSINGFTELTTAMIVGIAVALYAARVSYEHENKLSYIGYTELFLAAILFIVWNYSILGSKLAPLPEQIIPYGIGLVAVATLTFVWTRRRHMYLIGAALALALCNAVYFVMAVDYSNPDKLLLLGFLAALAALYAPLGIAYYQKINTTEKDVTAWSSITVFGASAIGLLLVWFGFWWFTEPITTVFVLACGLLFVLLGLEKGHDATRTVGLGIVGFIIAKIYLIDIWTWSTLWRFAALLPLGIVLISLPFWYQRLKK